MGKIENEAQPMRSWRLLTYFQKPLFRWALALTWTIIALSLMLSPAGDGTTVSEVSESFGGTEITDAMGHVILNTVLALLWCWTISLYIPKARTIRLLSIAGPLWGFGTELSQHFVPGRGTSLLDLTANTLGIVIGLAVYRWLAAR